MKNKKNEAIAALKILSNYRFSLEEIMAFRILSNFDLDDIVELWGSVGGARKDDHLVDMLKNEMKKEFKSYGKYCVKQDGYLYKRCDHVANGYCYECDLYDVELKHENSETPWKYILRADDCLKENG